MGYIKHDAIVVTSYSESAIHAAAANAIVCGLTVIGPCAPVTNFYQSILVCPDGSKEGWPESDDGEGCRAAFIGWLDSQRHEDGSTALEWVHVSYGSDDKAATVERTAWSETKEETR